MKVHMKVFYILSYVKVQNVKNNRRKKDFVHGMLQETAR